MFVHRTHRIAAVALGVLSFASCTDPSLNTDLRPEGPPDVLAVLVMTDAVSQLAEKATYCRPNDDKRPSQVGLPDFTTEQVCPDELGAGADMVTNAYPDGWYVRIMFDELLDPEIETLTEILDSDGVATGTFEGSIAAAHPVTLKCQSITGNVLTNVDYDGYYSPSGNRVTWPLGPSLVIKPNDPKLIATNKECEITINDSVTDKSGTEVAADQRGPYKFKIAPITVIANDPADSLDDTMPTEVDPLYLFYSNPYFQFNTDVQGSSFCADTDFPGTFANLFADSDYGSGLCDEGTEQFTLTPSVAGGAGGGWGVCNFAGDPCDTLADCTDPSDTHCDTSYIYAYSSLAADDEIGIGYNTPLKADTMYTFALKEGAKLKDRCGSETTLAAPTPDNLMTIRFKTNKFTLNDITPLPGETARMSKKVSLNFSNVVDPSSLDATEYSLIPAPASPGVGQFGLSQGEIIIGGNLAPDTTYTFTLNAGATISDYDGAVYTNATTKTITWKTDPKVLLTTSSPADLATVKKVAPQQLVGVSLTFNANMDVTTLTTDDFTFVNKAGVSATTLSPFLIGNGSSATGSNCSASSLSCSLRIRADLPPDDYTFTLKAGAQISDKLGNVYTQAADRIIHFTVEQPDPAVQCL